MSNLNESRFKKHEDVELMQASFTSQSFKPHFHEQFSLILVENGLADYSYKKNEYVVDSGKLLVLNPYEVHTGKSLDKGIWNSRSMYLSKNLVQEVYSELTGDSAIPFFKNRILKGVEFISEFRKIHLELINEKSGFIDKSKLYLLIEGLLQNAGIEEKEMHLRGNMRMVKVAKDYIHANYKSAVPLEDLERETGLSKFYLIKLFQVTYGLSPNRYLNNLRIEKAKSLLYKGMQCSEVAYETGFYDQSHFIRHFKKIVGVTPKAFA